jgi:hypothetical protein
LFFWSSKAKAVSMNDLQKQIQSLSEQINLLKSQVVGAVIGAIVPQTTDSSFTSPSLTIRKGTTSAEVSAIQSTLKAEGYFTGNVTGYYGDITAEAVSNYQKAKNLPVTGVVNDTTLKELKLVLSKNDSCVTVSNNTVNKLKSNGYIVSSSTNSKLILNKGVKFNISDVNNNDISLQPLGGNAVTIACGCPGGCTESCSLGVVWVQGSSDPAITCEGNCSGNFCTTCTWGDAPEA